MAIQEINQEYADKVKEIRDDNDHDEANIFLRTIFSLARLIVQTAHKPPVNLDFLNPVPA
ncbi:MAG: hypothetical protein LBJ12_08290 [Oscillospiraceae bacterium]|jgi:hypothetical protein|nr:hypothetical protein [Oscillospiraceae bacterium]